MGQNSKPLHSLQSLSLLWHDSLSSHLTHPLCPSAMGSPCHIAPPLHVPLRTLIYHCGPQLLCYSGSSQFCLFTYLGQRVWDAVRLREGWSAHQSFSQQCGAPPKPELLPINTGLPSCYCPHVSGDPDLCLRLSTKNGCLHVLQGCQLHMPQLS